MTVLFMRNKNQAEITTTSSDWQMSSPCTELSCAHALLDFYKVWQGLDIIIAVMFGRGLTRCHNLDTGFTVVGERLACDTHG
jgi:hypothetical protein